MRYLVQNEYINIRLYLLIPPLILLGTFINIMKLPMAPTCVSLVYISVFIYLYNVSHSFKEITKLPPVIIWALLTVYHLINARMHHVAEINSADFLHGFKVYASICIFCFFLSIDYVRTLKCLIFSCIVYVIINLFLSGFVMRGEDKLEGGISAVTFGKMGYMLAIYIIYYSTVRGYSFSKLIKNLICPMVIVLYAQTRTAFAVILIQLAGYYFSFVMKAKVRLKNIFILVPVILLTYFSVNYMIENTKLGERFTTDNFSDYQEAAGFKTGTIFDDIMGERLSYYIIGWNFFLNNPITGIGLDEYEHATGGNYPMHVEYMVHLAEGGLIGASLFVLFQVMLAFEIKKSKINKKTRWLVASTFIANLFMLMYSSTYEQEYAVIIYSIMLSSTLEYSKLQKI